MEAITLALLKSLIDKVKPYVPLLQKGMKSGADYIAKSHSLKTYPRNLQHRYGKLTIQGLKGCNSIDLLDIFVEQNAIEVFDVGQSDEYQKNSNQESQQENNDESQKQDSQQENNFAWSQQSESVLNILKKEEHRCVVILGDPGSGKSTLVRYLALDWARWANKELKQFGGHKMTIDSYLEPYLAIIGQGKTPKQFPILIELGEYIKNRKEGESFREYWYRGVAADRKLEKEKLTELNNKNILVIFDGLNEIEDRRLYRDTIHRIIQFANHHHLTKIVVTSREDNVLFEEDNRLFNATFSHFKLENFNDSQRKYFVDRWCNLITKKDKVNKKRRSNKSSHKKENIQQEPNKKEDRKEKREDRKKQLLREINRFTSISDRPQFLMMMVGILDDQDSLPSEQELYARLLRMLLASSNENEVDRREKQAILGLIAYKMQFGSPELDGNSIDDEPLKQLLISHLDRQKFQDPRSIAVKTIEELESDRFITVTQTFDSKDTYSFVNPKFLAYFCAREVKRQFKISLSINLENIFIRYWGQDSRHESLRLICGILDVKIALKLVTLLMNQLVDRADCVDKNFATKSAIEHLWLARECLAEIKDYHHINSRIDQELKEKLKEEIEIQKSAIRLNLEAAKMLTDSIAKHYHNEPNTLDWLEKIALENEARFVRSAAVQSIAEYYHYRSDDRILILLQNVATQDSTVAPKDPDELARRDAIRSIAEYYHTKKDLKLARWPDSRSSKDGEYNLLTWLQDCVDLDPDYLVRRESVRAIAKYYHNTSDTLEWLRDCAMQDLHAWVRQSAVQASALYYHKQPDTLKWLQDRALDDKHPNVIRAAIESITRYHHQKSETLEWLKGQANNNDELVDAAIQSIARYYQQESDTLKWLKSDLDRLNGKARKAVVVSISKYYYKEPGTLEWLKEIALKTDRDEPASNNWQPVKSIAVKSIAKYYYQKPGILEWLNEYANSKDERPGVRIAAVESVALYYHQKPGILEWLNEYANSKEEHSDVRIAAVKSIAQYYHYQQKLEILDWLKQYANNNKKHLKVRSEAVKSIAQYYHYQQKLEILDWLKQYANNEENHSNLRSETVKLIAQYYHQKPEILDWLKEYANNNEKHLDVRSESVKLIAHYYHQKPEILEWLKEYANKYANQGKYYPLRPRNNRCKSEKDKSKREQSNNEKLKEVAENTILKCEKKSTEIESLRQQASGQNKEKRRAAVDAIGKDHYENRESLKILQEIAIENKEADVRLIAVKSIAKYYHKHDTHQPGLESPNTLMWLQNIAIENKEADVRLVVVKSIAKYYHKRPDVLTCFQKIALEAQKADVRLVAVESIAKFYHKHDDTLTWLKHIALKAAEEIDVRVVAVKSIAKYYPKQPDILTWLKKIALTYKEAAISPDEKAVPAILLTAKESGFELNEIEASQIAAKEAAIQLAAKEAAIQLAAVESIGKYYSNAKYYPKHPDTLTWLKTCSIIGHYSDVRRAAAESISKYYYQKEPTALTWIQDVVNAPYDLRLLAEPISKKIEKSNLSSLKKSALEYPDKETVENIEKYRKAVEDIAKYYYQKESIPVWRTEESIGEYYKNVETLNSLKERVLNNPNPDVQLTAMESIARHYRNIATFTWLQEMAMEDNPNQDVRLFAVKSIVKYYRKEDDTLTWLKEIAMGPYDSNVRRIAVESIAKYYYKKEEKSNPITWLQEKCVVESKDEFVWKAALESIPKYYRKPCTLEWLKKDLVLNNKLDRLKRSAALQSIAKCYWDQSGTEWLQYIAENKVEDISLRVDAVKSIAQYYHKKPDTLEWLQKRFLYEEYEPEVRAAIVESIAKYYRKKSFIFTLLKESALNDYEPLVRSASIRAMNEYFPKNNEVTKILQLVIDRDIDRDIDDEDYPKAVAVKILKDRYK
jgi:HEAT repeats